MDELFKHLPTLFTRAHSLVQLAILAGLILGVAYFAYRNFSKGLRLQQTRAEHDQARKQVQKQVQEHEPTSIPVEDIVFTGNGPSPEFGEHLQVLEGQLTPAEHDEAKVLAYFHALLRGGGQLPPYDRVLAAEDFRRAAAEVVSKRPGRPHPDRL
jgi:hypothetical protein